MGKKIDAMTLIEGEEIIKRMRPHWIVLVPIVAIFVVFTTIYVFLFMTIEENVQGFFRDIFLWTITLIYIPSTLLLTMKRLIWWLTTKYLFTTKRIVTRTGLFVVKGESIALNKVQSIQFEKTLLERLVGSGSLIIESASENEIRIIFVTQAEQIQQRIYAQISSNEESEGVDRSV
jgi:uncharacterized membrane protein YdbT with pleckstrin-like domain